MAEVVLTRQADADIDEVLARTLRTWGEAQYWAYFDLIREALLAIAEDPSRGRPRLAVRPGVLGHHIKRPGHDARHIVFYVVDADTVTVLRLLHDSMDFERHLP